MRLRSFPLPEYVKDRHVCFRDPCRDFLVIATPEERVRQNVLRTLMEGYGYPQEALRTELKMARGKADPRRSDVVAMVPGPDSELNVPFLVVECKRPGIMLGQEVIEQGNYYVGKLGASFLVLTNGQESTPYAVTREGLRKVADIPTFEQACSGTGWEARYMVEPSYVRPSMGQLRDDEWVGEVFADHIGADTPRELWASIANLTSLFYVDEPLFTSPIDAPAGYRLVEDWGARMHRFTNAGGGDWPGWYRSLLVRDREGGDHLVRLALMASAKTEHDLHWGNIAGRTYLLVAVSDFFATHNALQLNVNTHWELDSAQRVVRVSHSGAMSGRGSYKHERVVSWVAQHAPELVEQDLVMLGSFPVERLLEWQDIELLVANLCVYALLRDGLRSEEKPGAKRGTPSKPAIRESLAAAIADPTKRDLPNRSGHTPLMQAAFRGYDDLVACALDAGTCLDTQDLAGMSALMHAASKGRLAAVERLMAAGANPDLISRDSQSALHLAIEGGFGDVVKALVGAGASTTIRDGQGVDALLSAIYADLETIACWLISRSVCLQTRSEGGQNPLHAAAQQGHLEVARLLVAAGLEVDPRDREGWTPLMFAAQQGHFEVLRLLLDAGADPHATCSDTEDPVVNFAADGDSPAALDLLLARGADPFQPNKEGRAALAIAASAGQVPNLVRLLALSHDLEVRGDDGATPLMLATAGGHLGAVEVLIRAGADLEAHDNEGLTALHIAVACCQLDSFRCLLAHGANAHALTAEGKTPLDLARNAGWREFEQVLILEESRGVW
ncbi:ankyrin repeat domain-containing protein [bacterium]|nr:ankyrin repeat domain-containing protein [bacterium]